jgi:hypothetical protein
MDKRNPYSFQDRVRMIRNVFTRERVIIHKLMDIPKSNEKWSQSIDYIASLYTDPILLHSRDSFKPHYLGKYPLKEVPELEGYSGTRLREEIDDRWDCNGDSPDGKCDYHEDDTEQDSCIYCGQPEERK